MGMGLRSSSDGDGDVACAQRGVEDGVAGGGLVRETSWQAELAAGAPDRPGSGNPVTEVWRSSAMPQ